MRIFGRRLARENDYLKGELVTKEKDITALRKRIEELEDLCRSLEEEIDTLQTENKATLKENKNLKTSQTLLRKKNEEYKENIKEDEIFMETEIRNYKANIEILHNTIDSIKTICTEAKGNTISKKKLLEELGE